MNLRDKHYFVQRVHPGVATFVDVYSIDNEFFRKVRGGNYIVWWDPNFKAPRSPVVIHTGKRW